LSFFFTILSYATISLYDFFGAAYAGKKISLKNAVAVSFTANAFGNSLGLSLLSSSAVRLRLYSLWRFTAAEIAQVIVFCEAASFAGFCALSPLFIFFNPQSGRVGILLAASGAVFSVLLIVYLIWGGFSKNNIAAFGSILKPPGIVPVISQLLFSTAEWLFSAAAFFVLLGVPLSYFIVFLSVFLASELFGIISNIPGGLGVFDASFVLLLSIPSITGPEILGALVFYRAVYYLLPLIASYFVYGAAEASHSHTGLLEKAGEIKDLLSSTPGYFFSSLVFFSGLTAMIISTVPYLMPNYSFISSMMAPGLQPAAGIMLSLCGAGLIMSARGLQKNLDSSYNISLGLLAASAAFVLINCFSYYTAGFFLIVLMCMLPFGKNFYRKNGFFTERPTTGFFYSSAAAVLLCGLALYLAPGARSGPVFFGSAASFFLSGTSVITWMIVYIFVPFKPLPHSSTKYDIDTAASIAFKSHDPLAQLALSGDKTLIFSWSRLAFIMYARCGSLWIALGDPYGPYVELEELIWKFKRLAASSGGSCAFFNVSGENLHFYSNTGLNFYKIGDEAKIALEYYPIDTAKDGFLREICGKLDSRGYSFRVLPRSASPAFFRNAAVISREWLKKNGITEPGFLLGRFDTEYLRHFHIACVFDKNEKLACFADVMAGPDRSEYKIDMIRSSADAPEEIELYLKYKLTLWGKDKHYAFFNLGTAPARRTPINSFTPAWNMAGAAFYNHGARFSSVWNIRKSLDKFSPSWSPRYVVCDNFFSVPRIFSEISLLSEEPGIKPSDKKNSSSKNQA
jgi:phosphatidylglycerol lysyltransferase